MDDLFKNHFQTTGEVLLPGVEEKIELPNKVWFRYDGEVKSLAANLARTELILRGIWRLNRSLIHRVMDWPMDATYQSIAEFAVRDKLQDIDQLTAYCYQHLLKSSEVSVFVIAKRKGLGAAMSTFADGHETGEFLQTIEAQDVLQGYLERQGIDLDVRKYHGEEFADIGGLLALKKAISRGVPRIEIPSFKARPPVLEEQRKAFGL